MNTTMTLNAGVQTTAPVRGQDHTAAIAKAKFAAMIVAAPLIGLAAVTLLPIAGLAVLMKTGFKALPQRVRDVALGPVFLQLPVAVHVVGRPGHPAHTRFDDADAQIGARVQQLRLPTHRRRAHERAAAQCRGCRAPVAARLARQVRTDVDRRSFALPLPV